VQAELERIQLYKDVVKGERLSDPDRRQGLTLNLSAFSGIGGARRGCVARVKGVSEGV
jgi:hypothetical protein